MARITVERALRHRNAFELVHEVVARIRQHRDGSRPLELSRNKEIVAAIRELEDDASKGSSRT